MTGPRLTAQARVSAMIRAVSAAGGFAAVLARGDLVAGAILVVHRRRDGSAQVLERRPDATRGSIWTVAVETSRDSEDTIQTFLDRQRRFDPDLWIIELDAEDIARFIDDPSPTG